MKSIINSKVTPEKKYPGLYTNKENFVYLMPDSKTAILVHSPRNQSIVGNVTKDDSGFPRSNLFPFIGSITIFSGD